jgi:hypothetical protein
MELLAMPYRIGPKYLPDYVRTPAAQSTWLEKHLPKSKVVFKYSGLDLRCYKHSESELVFFVTFEGGIHYVMELVKLLPELTSDLPAVLKRRTNFQASVWRSPKLYSKSVNFPATVCWKYLISKTRNLLSDSQQSDRGEAFWERRVVEALQNASLEVYGLDCERVGNTLKLHAADRILKIEDMPQYYSDEQDMSGYYKRLAIVKI